MAENTTPAISGRKVRSSNHVIVVPKGVSIFEYFSVLRVYLCCIYILFSIAFLAMHLYFNEFLIWIRLYKDLDEVINEDANQLKNIRNLIIFVQLYTLVAFTCVGCVFKIGVLFSTIIQSCALAILYYFQINQFPHIRLRAIFYALMGLVNLLMYLYCFLAYRHRISFASLKEQSKKQSRKNLKIN